MKTTVKTTLPFALFSFIVSAFIITSFLTSSFAVASNNIDTDSVTNIASVRNTPKPAEEPYINDIPFDTQLVVFRYGKAIFPATQAEGYVDDIPFNTQSVAVRYLPLKQSGIVLENEAYVNDIPFDTALVAARVLNSQAERVCTRKK